MGGWRMYIFKFVTCHQKGEELTQFLLLETPELGHLVEDCGKGVGPMMMQTLLGTLPGVSQSPHLAA